MEDNRGKTQRILRKAARVVTLPRSWSTRIEWRLLDGRGWLLKAITYEIEQRRLFPWIPVCFGIGILLFFQADGPPCGHRCQFLPSAVRQASPCAGT
ncbi:hypothetical protein AAII07_23340 [Microvirga sp. 0TCS3.31]